MVEIKHKDFIDAVPIDVLAVKCMMGKFSISAGGNGVLNQSQ